MINRPSLSFPLRKSYLAMYTQHMDHVVSVDDPEFSWSSTSPVRSPETQNEASPSSSPTSSPSRHSSSLSLPSSPSESDSPAPVVAKSTSHTSMGHSTRKSCTSRVTRSQIPKVRIRKLGAVSRPSAAPELDAGLSTLQETSIPKPEGENGRPNRGGYTLSKVLGWPAKDYRAAQVRILSCGLSLISNILIGLHCANCPRNTTLQHSLYFPGS